MPKIISGPIRVLALIHASHLTGPGRVVYGLARYIDLEQFVFDVSCPPHGYLPGELKKISVGIVPFTLANLSRLRSYHVFHIHSGQLNFFGKIVGRILGIPVIVLTEHLRGDDHSWIKNRFFLFIHLAMHHFSNILGDKVIAVSDAVRDSYIKRQKIDPSKVVTIHNGIDIAQVREKVADPLRIRREYGLFADTLVVGIVGRLSPEKGHRDFIRAAQIVLKKNPGVKFFIIGDGPQRQALEALAKDLGIAADVIFTGFKPNVYEMMDVLDVVVQPSHNMGEAFGLTVVEAMARQKAVIVSDPGCFREIIDSDIDGLMFPAGDYRKLAEKMLLLLNDRLLREQLGKAALKKAEDRFDVRLMVCKTQELYKQALASKGFYCRRDLVKKIADDFMSAVKQERGLSSEKIDRCRVLLEWYFSLVKDRPLSFEEVSAYLGQKDNFCLEMFLEFLDRHKITLDKISFFNLKIFKRVLQKKAVTDRDYDERMKMQTLQFQIDNYYNPVDEAQKKRIEIVLSLLEPQAGERVLDVGCGVGTFAYHSAKCGAQAFGADYSQASIEVAQQLAQHFGLQDKIQFVCADIAHRLPYPDSYFDKIAAIDFVEHITAHEKKQLLSEMFRVLKPEGFVVIYTPNAIREFLGFIKSRLVKIAGGYASETRLHFGLTNRFAFENMLRQAGWDFRREFFDVDRPVLARIPFFKEFLSLNLVWILKKREIQRHT